MFSSATLLLENETSAAHDRADSLSLTQLHLQFAIPY